jgi:putative ABC transport system permease protein
VTLGGFALRNAFLRNRTRSVLTVLGVCTASLVFVFLRTVLGAWYANSEASASDRVVARNAISITQTLPLSYKDRIAQVPGVTKVTWSNWFGGVYKDRKNFFAQFAIDAQSGLDVLDIRFLQGGKEAFLADRNSCIVGKAVAEKYGFKLGDTVPLQGDIYPGDWQFRVAGIVDGGEDSSVGNTMYFHWARLNEGLPERRRDQVGIYTMTVANAAESPRVVKAIDELFANSDNETRTETEKSFRLQFVVGSSAILGALQAASGLVLLILALILGNTLAMGLRERTSELGAMRAIGFLPRHVQLLAWSEGAMLGLVGGAIGILLARPMLNAFGKALSNMGFLSGLGFSLPTAAITLGAAGAIGTLASAIPAWTASRMDVVAALRKQE